MTRCVYLTFFGEPRGAAADPHHQPHESGPRIVVPLLHPGRRWPSSPASSTCPAFGWLPDALAPAVRALRRADGAATSRRSPTPSSRWWIAVLAGAARLPRHRPRLRLLLAAARFHGVTERSRAGPRRLHAARQQVLLRPPLHRRHRRRRQGPDRPGRLLVQPERHRRRRQRRRPSVAVGVGRLDVQVDRPGGGRRRRQRLGRAVRGTSARCCAGMQTGKVQQYGALLFGGAVVLAGIFVFAI